MAFGNCYHYEEQAVALKPGVYEVCLERPYETDINGFHVLKFPFTVDGINQRTNPDSFILFDVKDDDDPEKVQAFIRKASRIKACFILKGRFTEENYLAWTGKKGCIFVIKNEQGYMEVKDFLQNVNLTAEDKVQL